MNEHLFQAAWPLTQTNRHTMTQTHRETEQTEFTQPTEHD